MWFLVGSSQGDKHSLSLAHSQAFICLGFASSQEVQNVVLRGFRESPEVEPVETGFLLQVDVCVGLHCNWHQL